MLTSAELQFALSKDPESTFCRQLEALIERSVPPAVHAPDRDWNERPFSPLLLGYTGQGNVGADIRVREIVRQLQLVFAHVRFDPRLAVMGDVGIDPVLNSLRQIKLDGYFPDFIGAQMHQDDGVIACEGSMFTSTFSDVLSATFAAGIGYAARAGKVAIGYGAEAGKMSDRLHDFVQKSCQGGLLLARSRQTQAQLSSMGLNAQVGADPAWTFDPSDQALLSARQTLRDAGWDGVAPAVALCPINPFWWPVEVDIEKARAMKQSGKFRDLHYHGVFFHATSEAAEQKFARYLQALAATIAHLRGRGYFPYLVGMEKLDARSCERLNALLLQRIPVFVSGMHSAESIVALLRQASLVITSRFHAAVLSLNGLVPTIGIALDSRIENLFSENGLATWFYQCDTEFLGDKLIAATRGLPDVDLSEVYVALVRNQIAGFGEMGIRLHDEVMRVYRDFPASPLDRHWRSFLPPLSRRLEALLG